MADEPTIGTNLPIISAESAGLAVTTIGGVLVNLLVYHAIHFRDQRHAALGRAVKIALDAVAVVTPMGASETQTAEAKALVIAVIRQAEAHASKELVRRPEDPERDEFKVN